MVSNFDLNGVAIITGANKGLGFAITKELCKNYRGTVYLTSREVKRGENALAELKKLGYNPEYYQLDITNDDSVVNFCDFIKNKHGKNIDILINNAGILFLKDCVETKIYQATETLKVNFFSTVKFTESMLPLIKDSGSIVNISSSSGHLSRIPSGDLKLKFLSKNLNLENLIFLVQSYLDSVKEGKEIEDGWGDSPYVVSKVGLNAYTFLLHKNLSFRGVKVNCVHPGYVKSDMTKGSGTVEPEEAANLPVSLALQSDCSGLYIWHDGTTVPFDGPDPRILIDGKS